MSPLSSTEERTAPAVRSSYMRSICSFPGMLVALLMLLAVLTVRDRFSDPDMWWHMRTGQVIWTTHSIPRTDLFSWTTNHHAWIPHEWLSQVIIYGAYRFGGYSGLMLLLCAMTAAVILSGYLLCALYGRNAKVAFIGALVVWFFATSGMSIRPQMIGYLLLIVELIVIHCGSTRNPRWFYCLPPLFAIWVNCHGSFVLGLIIGAGLLGCSFVTIRNSAIRVMRCMPRTRRIYASALLLSAAALFINPVGPRLIFYPFDMMFRQPINVANVQEWQPLAITAPRGAGVMVALLAIAALLILLRREIYLHELMLLVVGTWLALSHARLVFVFGILVAPLISRLLSPYWEGYTAARDLPIANAMVMFAAAATAFIAFPSKTLLNDQVSQKNPVGAIDYIRSHKVTGNMLNDWTNGGYLVWALPDRPVFIDGRGDIFEETGVLADYGRWALLQSDPRVLLEKYHIDYCLLSRDSPMSHVMPLLPGWHTVYSDDAAIIFVRDNGR